MDSNRPLYVKGKINNKDNQLKILVDSIEDLRHKEVSISGKESTNFVHIADESGKGSLRATIVVPEFATETDLVALKTLLSAHRGDVETYVVIGTNGATKKVKMPSGIDFSNGIVADINALLSRRG